MANVPPPLLGFNNNVRHRGRVFHIQTEDSGVKRPHIITHLFADGGRIVNTAKTEYAEHVGRDDMAQVVRRLMKEQHKAMFIRLRAGELDGLIEAACGPSPEPALASAAVAVAAASADAGGELPADGKAATIALPTEAAADVGDALSSLRAPAVPGPPTTASLRGSKSRRSPSVAALHLPDPPSSPDNEPPAEAAEAAADATPAVAAGPADARPSDPSQLAGRRYAPSRPAAIFADMPNPGSSIFGGSISEQSLDEVILSYLAEDLDDGK